MPNVSNAQFKNIMNISFLVFLNKDANTEEETLTVDKIWKSEHRNRRHLKTGPIII